MLKIEEKNKQALEFANKSEGSDKDYFQYFISALIFAFVMMCVGFFAGWFAHILIQAIKI